MHYVGLTCGFCYQCLLLIFMLISKLQKNYIVNCIHLECDVEENYWENTNKCVHKFHDSCCIQIEHHLLELIVLVEKKMLDSCHVHLVMNILIMSISIFVPARPVALSDSYIVRFCHCCFWDAIKPLLYIGLSTFIHTEL